MVQLHHVWVVWPARPTPPDHNRPDGTSFDEITKPRLSVRSISDEGFSGGHPVQCTLYWDSLGGTSCQATTTNWGDGEVDAYYTFDRVG
jgi:hypothetical protein